MDIVNVATEWARAEAFSARFFIIFAALFLAASFGFWQLGKTELARAYIVPTLIAGALLMTIGMGIYFGNKSRVTSFAKAYASDPTEFVKSEIVRAEKTMAEFRTIVFKVIPGIIALAALLIVFVDKPIWRASCITVIAMMVVLLLVDSNSNARILEYHQRLMLEARRIVSQTKPL